MMLAETAWTFRLPSTAKAKDHGEGGVLIGAPLQRPGADYRRRDFRRHLGARIGRADPRPWRHPAAVSIALDRKRARQGELSAVQEVQRDYGMPVVAIATLDDLLGYLAHSPDLADNQAKVRAYRDQYGV